MRVFISIPLPKTVKKELAEIKKEFSQFPAKWVEEENLHLTLVFIGKVKSDKVRAVSDSLSSIGHKPISLKTDGLHLFPSEKKPHLLVAGLTGETGEISLLITKIKEGLRQRKINFDEKPFRPHITLGRLKRLPSGERRKLKERVQTTKLPELEFEVKTIQLTESKLTPLGPIYKAISAVALR